MKPLCPEIHTGRWRHVQVLLRLFDGRDGASQRGVGSQIERHGHGRKLPLVIDRERLGGSLNMSERAQRHGIGGRVSWSQRLRLKQLRSHRRLDLMAFEGALRTAEDGVYATASRSRIRAGGRRP